MHGVRFCFLRSQRGQLGLKLRNKRAMNLQVKVTRDDSQRDGGTRGGLWWCHCMWPIKAFAWKARGTAEK